MSRLSDITARNALLGGFAKGFCAMSDIYSPPEVPDIPEIQRVSAPATPPVSFEQRIARVTDVIYRHALDYDKK